MKRLIVLMVLMAAALYAVLFLVVGDAEGQRIFSRPSLTETGYPSAICSTYVNTDTGGYAKIDATSGYAIAVVRVIPIAPGAAQTFGLRLWHSATDSTLMSTTIALASGATSADAIDFPIACEGVSLTSIAATDDFCVVCFLKMD